MNNQQQYNPQHNPQQTPNIPPNIQMNGNQNHSNPTHNIMANNPNNSSQNGFASVSSPPGVAPLSSPIGVGPASPASPVSSGPHLQTILFGLVNILQEVYEGQQRMGINGSMGSGSMGVMEQVFQTTFMLKVVFQTTFSMIENWDAVCASVKGKG